MVLAAVAFVAVTIGTSLLGRTAFYGGGNLVDNQPWSSYGHPTIEVTNGLVGDTIDYFIPGRSQLVDRVRDGDLPGWNPLQGAGAELASVPSYGLLAPTGLAWWVLPHDLAPGWEKLTILVLATAGTALFLRRLRVGRHAAWLGGMVYAGSGFMIAWTNWPQAGVAAMLPWLLWSTERALQLRTWRAQVPVALTVAVLLLGGFPAVTGLGIYCAAGFLVLRVLTRDTALGARWSSAAADLGRLSVALATGVLLAGVQLATFLYTYADLDTGYRENQFDVVLPLRMALTALFPNAWGTMGGAPFFTTTNPIEANAHLGVAAVMLALVAVLVRPRAELPRGARAYFAGVVVVSALLIYVQGPLLDWVGLLPVFSGNAIGRLMSVLLLAAAVLAGLGCDAALSGSPGWSRSTLVRVGAGLAVAVVAVLGLALWVRGEVGALLDPGPGHILLLATVGAAVVAAAVVVAGLRPSWRGPVLGVVPIVVVVQAVAAATPAWAQVDRSQFYPATPVHEYLLDHVGDDRIAVTGATMVNGSTAYYGLPSATGHVFNSSQVHDLQEAVCRECQVTATYWVLPSSTDVDLWQSPGLDRLAVRYLATDPESVIPGTEEQVATGEIETPVPTADEAPMTVTVPGGPLRGVLLDFRSGPAEVSSGHLVAEVRDEEGTVLVSTRRLVQFSRPAVALYVALAGEDLPVDGTYTIELHWAGPTAPPILATDASGSPSLSVIRPADDGLRLAFANGTDVWERLTALPRIRWASTTEVIPAAEERIDAVGERGLPADTVVLEDVGPSTDGEPATLDVDEGRGDEISATLDAEGAGYLVVAESVQTDWTATVDGVEQEIVAADHAFGAVFVPAGHHEVSLSYTPRGATAGLAATGVGMLALVLMLLPPTVWRRRRPDGDDPPGGRGADDTLVLTRTPTGMPQ